MLGDIVGKQQTTFISGRKIGDNIILAKELLINYHRDKGSLRCDLKVDLIKAYDFVRWDFVLTILRIVGFTKLWSSGLRNVSLHLDSLFVLMANLWISFPRVKVMGKVTLIF